MQSWTSPGGNTPQDTNCTATYLLSRKLFKLDEPDMQDTAGEAGTNSWEMYSYGPPHMAVQKQDDQHEHTFSSYVRIWNEDLPRAMNDREEWRERVRNIRATSATWWWWWVLYSGNNQHEQEKMKRNFLLLIFYQHNAIAKLVKDFYTFFDGIDKQVLIKLMLKSITKSNRNIAYTPPLPLVFIIITIIITKACRQHGFPSFFFVIHPYQPSQLVSPWDRIHCWHRVNECKFLLVGQHWCVHV